MPGCIDEGRHIQTCISESCVDLCNLIIWGIPRQEVYGEVNGVVITLCASIEPNGQLLIGGQCLSWISTIDFGPSPSLSDRDIIAARTTGCRSLVEGNVARRVFPKTGENRFDLTWVIRTDCSAPSTKAQQPSLFIELMPNSDSELAVSEPSPSIRVEMR